MIRITKVSSQKYHVFAHEDDFRYLIYTIKRVAPNRYIIRNMFDDVIIMNSLKEAKDFVKLEKTQEDVNWLSYFVRHTKGKKFVNQQESNKHMSLLSKRWNQYKQSQVCSLNNGCFCKSKSTSSS